MRKFYVLLVAATLIGACTKQTTMTDEKKTYVPGTPTLSSDVMTPEVLWSFGRVGNTTLSPDGTMVLFAVTYYNKDENKGYRELYTVPVSGGDVSRITNTATNESEARWRPDGKKIGYLSSESGSVQLWEMNPDGTEAVQVTEIEGGISGFNYSPDLSKIFYIKAVKLDENVQDLFPDLPKANARLESDLMYRHWDSWHDYTYNHIFFAEYGNGKITSGKDILEGEKYDSPDKPFDGSEQVAWSPDSKSIVYSCKKLLGKAYAFSTNTDLYQYDLETGETRNLTEVHKGYDKNPVFSPDGNLLAWTSMERDGYESDQTRLFVMDMTTEKQVNYSAGWEQNAGHLSWGRNGNSIFFISDIHATEEIYRLDLADGKITRLTDGVHDYHSVVETADGKLLAEKVSMSQPAELYLVDPATGTDVPLTAINKGLMDQLTLGKVEKRWVKTVDDKDMLVWVIFPPHFDPSQKYPAILYCQGGPQGTVSQFWSYRWNFQQMAANGYIVVAPNRRGLPGFGMEWLEQISKDYGGLNIQDYLSAIDNVAKEPYVDENRLGAVGASYGGFSVNYLAGHHEGRFKAFISHCGIFNFEQQYVTTEEMWFEDWDIGGPYWDKTNQAAQRSYSFSPHLFVEKWDTPILVIHGEKDFRIPYTQGMGAFNAAVMRDIPAQFLFFPEENHWVVQPQNGILWQRVFKNWLDKWLK
ncbi:S9 family peptidase [Gaoshiqia sediminis]|uniref:Dipeptidyl-peptidase 5 n=1 Tax=Gaoshiqia sediminis TaxID=2986998 RepID=A0AA41YAE5_9BACT|nr:S9 family peptidase [Gaoshiqia sediminis]MCW0482245.1 S9 family peptidase [Gaoshiqia sediminis]